MAYLWLIVGAIGVILVSRIWNLLAILTWRRYAMVKMFKKQGVSGPEYKFCSGCLDEIKTLKIEADEIELNIHSHDVIPRVFPHYFKWMTEYGGTFLYWYGPQARLCITDPEKLKQVLTNKFGIFTKSKPSASLLADLLGKGLALTEGEEWARHRRIVSPAFTMDKLKGMAKKMANCTLVMLDKWHVQMIRTEGNNKIDVSKQFHELTADIISHAAFGSSYMEGKEVFLAQNELQMLILANILNIFIPALRYLPTKSNIKKWRLDRKMRKTLIGIIQNRLNSKGSGYGNDLLGIMIESNQKQEGQGMNIDEIISNCKTFFFGGHETTSHLLTWTMFLLSTNQKWQEKLREEVLRECGTEIPNADNLTKLKLVTMVLFEALRLYSPVVLTDRQTTEDMNLGNLILPKGVIVTIPYAIIHHDKEIWGEDANKFNPLRFENGIGKAAKHPSALLAFSVGPRACVGQNFAMMEAKIVIAMILQRFSFNLSPDHKHKPVNLITLQPQYGLPIVLKPLVL